MAKTLRESMGSNPSPIGRMVLASAIHPDHWQQQPPRPVLRVWIPKPGTAERRPLAILSMLDRCRQALAKMALEPEWEAQFEPHSYGYRPGRGAHDAIRAILLAIEHHPTFVLVADIEGAFDHINQAVLLDKLQTYPALRQAINAWLKAGIRDGGAYVPSETGIPQGGALSPLLMNVALHGMETAIIDSDTGNPAVESPLAIRYADDFLVFHSNLEEIQKAAARVENWLKQIGLGLNSRKTYITHTLSSYQGQLGFDFLGFTIRQYPPEKSEPEQLLTCKT
ncbi:MAG TPA: reverse transcriptase/maturase family protein, partial [Ktedonobacteraceae bacterium]|nr:reverse transcriptase/maturase family protein [Ktedonobacteraceae bacterium]